MEVGKAAGGTRGRVGTAPHAYSPPTLDGISWPRAGGNTAALNTPRPGAPSPCSSKPGTRRSALQCAHVPIIAAPARRRPPQPHAPASNLDAPPHRIPPHDTPRDTPPDPPVRQNLLQLPHRHRHELIPAGSHPRQLPLRRLRRRRGGRFRAHLRAAGERAGRPAVHGRPYKPSIGRARSLLAVPLAACSCAASSVEALNPRVWAQGGTGGFKCELRPLTCATACSKRGSMGWPWWRITPCATGRGQ